MKHRPLHQSLSSAAPGTGAEEAFTLRAVAKVYRSRGGAVEALREVTLAFAAGSFTVVIGPSGSGKGTLLQCAAGLDWHTSGEVRVAGHDLGRLNARLTVLGRERIGFGFQSFNLLPSLTTELNVALPLRLAGRRPGDGTSGTRSPPSAWRTGPGAAVRRPAAAGGDRQGPGHQARSDLRR
jgi:ABC-type lipoprotein export system ATPase subunit